MENYWRMLGRRLANGIRASVLAHCHLPYRRQAPMLPQDRETGTALSLDDYISKGSLPGPEKDIPGL